MVKGGPAAATRATLVLSAMLQWATSRGFRADNPAKGVKLNKPTHRERLLTAAELGRLGEAFQKGEQQGLERQSAGCPSLAGADGRPKERNRIAQVAACRF